MIQKRLLCVAMLLLGLGIMTVSCEKVDVEVKYNGTADNRDLLGEWENYMNEFTFNGEVVNTEVFEDDMTDNYIFYENGVCVMCDEAAIPYLYDKAAGTLYLFSQHFTMKSISSQEMKWSHPVGEIPLYENEGQFYKKYSGVNIYDTGYDEYYYMKDGKRIEVFEITDDDDNEYFYDCEVLVLRKCIADAL